MELFDTHFHCSAETGPEKFMEQVRADLELNSGVFAEKVHRLYLLCAGADHAGSLRAMQFAEVVKDAYFSAGVHPHDAAEYRKSGGDFSGFKDHPKLCAAGEIGLDYFYGYSDRQTQLSVFQEFLELALQWQKPAMLHLRDKDGAFEAYHDAWELLKDFSGAGGRFVIHCYAGDANYAEKFLELGGFFGVTGLYTFKAAENIRSAIAVIPPERLLVETDSPYLAPVPYRGRVNSPGMVGLVAAALGSSFHLTPEAAADFFTANGKRFYGIEQE